MTIIDTLEIMRLEKKIRSMKRKKPVVHQPIVLESKAVGLLRKSDGQRIRIERSKL